MKQVVRGPDSRGVLYLSYDGMLEPLGQSQVLAYLERLAADRPIHLVSFEKPDTWADAARREAIARRIAAAGIAWRPLPYHKRPSALATSYDIARGIAAGTALVRRHGLGIVHARSYVPATMALAIKRLTGAKFLFDMRGLWADERVDGGLWPKDGYLYRTAKGFERRFLESADAVITLTDAAEAEIRSFPYLADKALRISVIPTCADLERFSPGEGQAGGGFTLGFVGSAGGWNDFDAVLSLFAAIRAHRPEARLLVVNRDQHELVRSAAARAGLSGSCLEVVAADHSDVPRFIRGMTAGVAFRKPAYSNLASAPTKMAEYLGCGIPCVGNERVGDVGRILEDNRVGVTIAGPSADAHAVAARRLLMLLDDPQLAGRCRSTAEAVFSLAKGVSLYSDVYDRLTADAQAVR